MPKNKDQKRVIRARMQKTGESYTTAHTVVLERAAQRGPYAAPRKEWPALAGHGNAILKEKTGGSWAHWVAELDAIEAHAMSHGAIVKHILREHPKISGWWAQTLAVGYERIRGMRAIGQRLDGTYEASKSRTFPVGVGELYRMFYDARQRKRWLPEGVVRVRTATPNKSLRVDWQDGTQVNLFFVAKGPRKSTLSVQHAKLGSKADVDREKALWQERLGALGRVLA